MSITGNKICFNLIYANFMLIYVNITDRQANISKVSHYLPRPRSPPGTWSPPSASSRPQSYCSAAKRPRTHRHTARSRAWSASGSHTCPAPTCRHRHAARLPD